MIIDGKMGVAKEKWALQRLVEMLRQARNGAEDWPVLFTGVRQHLSGEWQEVGGCDAITAVEVVEGEVLLIRDLDDPPLSVSGLEHELAGLVPRCSDFTVESCEKPIVVDGERIHIDLAVDGGGRDEEDRCYLLVCVSRME
jgi:hypothetical protein